MLITTIDELPDYPSYLWGFDLSLSGWGPFGYPETPDRMRSMERDEYWGRGDYQGYATSSHYKQLCPVIYCLQDDTDVPLLQFNCWTCDVLLRDGCVQPRGKPTTEPAEGWDAWAKAFKDKNYSTYGHSIVYGVLGMMSAKQFEAYGICSTLEWLMRRGIPYITVRTPEDCERWYQQPGLGWTFYDAEHQAYKYDHPRVLPKRGDYALECDAPGEWYVRQQRYTYRGREKRYKVTPIEEHYA